MTNAEILMMNMALLIGDGVIKPDATINTYMGWKKRGYQVKSGAEHVAAFPIWIHRENVNTDTEESEEDTNGSNEPKPKKKRRDFVFQTAYWFTNEQVEPISSKK